MTGTCQYTKTCKRLKSVQRHHRAVSGMNRFAGQHVAQVGQAST